jgi:hypothetical protein
VSVTCSPCGRDLSWSIEGRPPPYGFDRRCALNCHCHMTNGRTWLELFPAYEAEWSEGVDEIWERE